MSLYSINPQDNEQVNPFIANCRIEHEVIDPETNDTHWTLYETMTIRERTFERLTNRAYGYISRPERYPNVVAIRLTGTATLLDTRVQMVNTYTEQMTLRLEIIRRLED